jgi:hypothetical protein
MRYRRELTREEQFQTDEVALRAFGVRSPEVSG